MTRTVLIANRGEIAVRIIRTATELGLRTVVVYTTDDADGSHVFAADGAVRLPGTGPAGYLDHGAMLAAAAECGAALIHPGYGFLSENAEFARAVTTAGLSFVGPDADLLETFGDKPRARQAAIAAGLPVPAATSAVADPDQLHAFFAAHPGGIMLKALSGGGGRGIRAVHSADRLGDAYRSCAAEARLGFGAATVFAEEMIAGARHIEVQIVAAPGAGGTRALALGDRDCSIQRSYQKLVEIAPAAGLSDATRRDLHEAAARLCAHVGYRGLATVEFLVADGGFRFLEVNPRIQVEHTITEEVTGVDLVAVQFAIADGAAFDALDLPAGVSAEGSAVTGEPAAARGVALQVRVNTETVAADGSVRPTAGTLTGFTPPTGPGIRVDTHGRPGLTVSPRYDTLLAKVISHVHARSWPAAARKARIALAEFVVAGVDTNIGLLQQVLAEIAIRPEPVTTGWLAERLPELTAECGPRRTGEGGDAEDRGVVAGERVLRAPMAGTVAEVTSHTVVLEAMKMQHVVAAPRQAETTRALVRPGQMVQDGDPLLVFTGDDAAGQSAAEPDLDAPRADLEEVRQRRLLTRDEGRPDAVAKRHRQHRRTARENIADLVDPGSFVEYGALALAAQRSRRSEADLIANTPADGLVAGVATIGGSETVVVSYDYTVLAGTQGMRNHAKTDRVFELAGRRRLPVVLFAEGGGGRPGDTDAGGRAGLELMTFRTLAGLRGRAPLVSIVSGRCFAGNAALAGVCDVIIATPDANIGMGGPAMIEGGGLGCYRPEEIGPIDVQRRNGVVGLAARDESHAVELAKRYLSYFRVDTGDWQPPDPRLARHVVPANRLRAYDVHRAIESIADVGSVLRLRDDYGVGLVTALVRVEGVPYGLLANSSHHLGGAIDAEAADKAADFLEMCEAFRLPVVSLCDTPGFMVGPDAERQATVRRFGRMFVAGARLTVPMGMIVLRKGYGLGAMAMAGGSFHAPQFTVAWPTGEIGGMGLEGAVRLGFSKELAAVADPTERRQLFDQLLEAAYQHGKALHSATTFELDDVIDPADSRSWLRGLRTTPPS